MAGSLAGIKGKPEILSEGDSLSGLLEMIEMRFDAMSSPQRVLFSEFGLSGYRGLEYRWGL